MKQNVETCSDPEGFSQVFFGRETGEKMSGICDLHFLGFRLCLAKFFVEGEQPQCSESPAQALPCAGACPKPWFWEYSMDPVSEPLLQP